MGASIRPAPPDDPLADYDPAWRRAEPRATRATAAPASTDPLTDYTPDWRAKRTRPAPNGAAPSLGTQWREAVGHALSHPVETLAGFVAAPVEQFARAFDTPTEGDVVTSARYLRGKAGPSPASTRLPIGTVITRQNTPGAQTRHEQRVAAVQTLANVAAPRMLRGARAALGPLAGSLAAASGIGAVQNPDNPKLGAALGLTFAGATHAVGAGARAGYRAVVPNVGDAVPGAFADVAAVSRGTSPLESWVTDRSTPAPGTAAAVAMARADALAAGGAADLGARSLTRAASIDLPPARVTRPVPPSRRPALVEAPPMIGGRGQRAAAEVEREAIRATLAERPAPAGGVPGGAAALLGPDGQPVAAPAAPRGAPRRTFDALGSTQRPLPEGGGVRRRPAPTADDAAAPATEGARAPATGPASAAELAALQDGTFSADGARPAAPGGLRPLASASPERVQLRPGVAGRVARDLDARPDLPRPTAEDLDPLTGVLAQAEPPAPVPPKIRPEFRAAHTDDLLARLGEEQHRLEAEANDPSRGGYVRQTDVGEVVSGGTFRGGRMERGAKLTAARILELETELRRRRGLDEDTIGGARLAGYERAVESGAAGGRVRDVAGDDPFGLGHATAPDDFDPAFLGESAPTGAPLARPRATPGRAPEGGPEGGAAGELDPLADYHAAWRAAGEADVTNGTAAMPVTSATHATAGAPDLPPAAGAGVNWRTWLDEDAPGGRTVLARVQARAAALEPELRAARGYQSRLAQAIEAHTFARELVADPLTIDRAKVGRLTGPQVVALKGVIADNTAAIEGASRALAAGELAPAEAARAEAVITTAQRATDEALGLVVGESARMGRDLGALRQLARQSVDPDLWLVQAKKMMGDRPLPDAVMVEVRRLARAAADACGGA